MLIRPAACEKTNARILKVHHLLGLDGVAGEESFLRLSHLYSAEVAMLVEPQRILTPTAPVHLASDNEGSQ